MSEIEKMKRYIERTKIRDAALYQMTCRELRDLILNAQPTPLDVVCLAFNYGKAKGYRAAKAEGKKATA